MRFGQSAPTIKGLEARREGVTLDRDCSGLGSPRPGLWLLPAEPQRALWFSDGLSFHDDSKTKAAALHGMVMVRSLRNAPAATKAEVESIKSFRQP